MSTDNQHDNRQVKADEVKRGDHVFGANGAPIKVTHIQDFQRRGCDWLLIVTADGDSTEYEPGDPVTIASEATLAAIREAAERAETIAATRNFLDWLEAHPEVPAPYMRHQQAGLHGDGDWDWEVAEVNRVAAALGEPARFHVNNGREIAEVNYSVGAIRYCLYTSRIKPAEPQSIEDAPPRGIQDGDPDAAPVDHDGHAPTKPARTHDTSRRYDPNPTLTLGDGISPAAAWFAHAADLDSAHPGWWDDPTDGMAPELAVLAMERRTETYAMGELDQDRVPTVEGFEAQRARTEGGA